MLIRIKVTSVRKAKGYFQAWSPGTTNGDVGKRREAKYRGGGVLLVSAGKVSGGTNAEPSLPRQVRARRGYQGRDQATNAEVQTWLKD